MSRHDVFDRPGLYEGYVGRWSRRLAAGFVVWLGVPPGARWLDVGCGTGALTQAILDGAHPAAVIGIDPAPAFVEHAARAVSDPRATFSTGNAMALEFAEHSFDVAAAALVLNFVPDPLHATREMLRVCRQGGTVGAYVWDYADGMRMMRYFWDAAAQLDPAASDLDQGRRFPICRPDALRTCWETAGLENVDVIALDMEMVFTDFDDYWNPFLGGQGPAAAYAMSLGDAARERLRDLIRSLLPMEADGSIHISSRAWAVRGRVPAGNGA